MRYMEEVGDQKKSFEFNEEFPEFTGWEAIGFHRPLANELWEIVLEAVNNSLYIFVIAYLVPLLQPFLQIRSVQDLSAGLFLVVYTIFDTGTNFNLGRFIAEYRVKNPKK